MKKTLFIILIVLAAGVAWYAVVRWRGIGMGDDASTETPSVSSTGERLNYAKGSRPQNARYEFIPEGVLVTWDTPKDDTDIERYLIESGGPILYRKVGETGELHFIIPLVPGASECNMTARITPIDQSGARMLPAYVHGITRKMHEEDCGPQR